MKLYTRVDLLKVKEKSVCEEKGSYDLFLFGEEELGDCGAMENFLVFLFRPLFGAISF
jgi:hypothetical protein